MPERIGIDAAALARNWWALAIRGVLAIVFGVLAAVMPHVTLAVLILMFGAYAIVEGIFNVIAAVRTPRGERHWLALLVEGLVSIAAGVLAILLPHITALALLYLIAAWALVSGILAIAAAVRLRKEIEGEWWLALNGVAAIVFAVLVMIAPGAGALAVVLWIGVFAIVFGILLLVLAFRLRSARPELPGALPHTA